MVIKKKKGKNFKDHDVLISIHGCGCVKINFRQGSYWKITNTGFMDVSLENNQIYFEESDEKGFKVSVSNPQIDYGVVSCLSDNQLHKWAEENGGRYDLIKVNNRFTISNRR